MKAYKGFNADMTCRGFQFEEGKTYEHDGEVKLCKSGFHACEDPLDLFKYYYPSSSEFHEVELDDVSDEREADTKVVAKKITIGAKLSLDKLIKACIAFRLSKMKRLLVATSNIEDGGIANSLGSRGTISNSGCKGVAYNAGNQGVASNTGRFGAAFNMGFIGVASNTGYCGIASNEGSLGIAFSIGDTGVASNTGVGGTAFNAGCRGAAETSGTNSIAVSVGYDSKARGALGTWIVLAERNEWNGKGYYSIKNIKAFKVDGEEVKADTWYKLVNGVLRETKNEED